MSNWIGGKHLRLVATSANRGVVKVVEDGIEKQITVVLIGVRHWDGHMRAQAEACKYNLEDVHFEQGFIDNSGVFMDRKEALAVAMAAGQLNVHRSKTDPETELFSEDFQ